jgi:hypothetical protein
MSQAQSHDTQSTEDSAAKEQSVRLFGLLSSLAGAAGTSATKDIGGPEAFQFHWQTRRLSPVKVQTLVIETTSAPTVPAYIHDFAKTVSQIENVCRVIAEEGEDGRSIHVTTFANDLTDEIRTRIYDVEANFIEQHPDVIFDFHLRREEEATGAAVPVAAKYYYAVWGFRDANTGRAPKTSGR